MKKFYKYFAIPLLISIIASVLYLIDALIGNLFIDNGSFMWVAFAIWTIFYSAKIKDRIKGLIGVVFGFIAAIIMMSITNSFSLNIYTISISCLLGVFLVNFVVMSMDKADKILLGSVSGIFGGIFLTFSGLGVGLNPLNNLNDAFLTLGILVTYTILGLACGFFSILGSLKINNALKNKYQSDK